MKGAPALLWSSSCLSSELIPAGPYLSYVGDPRAGCSAPGRIPWEPGGENHIPRSDGHTAFDAAQGKIGFFALCLAHVELLIHKHPQTVGSYPQHIPGPSRTAYAMLCHLSNRCQGGWSAPWRPGLVNVGLLLPLCRGSHPLILPGQVAYSRSPHNVLCPCTPFNSDP